MTVEEYLKNVKGLNTWYKGNYKRIYINDLEHEMSVVTPNPKSFRKCTLFYDCVKKEFVWQGLTSSREKTALAYCEYIKKLAKNAE